MKREGIKRIGSYQRNPEKRRGMVEEWWRKGRSKKRNGSRRKFHSRFYSNLKDSKRSGRKHFASASTYTSVQTGAVPKR